ncbi:MAG TPA: HD domain-containing protein [Candidatus Acidoferrum sp.]|nr:HD domain-containing protein [Candidatus Acidoferrum sp.]
MDHVKRILDFLALSERLKLELRHSWLSSGRQESVAEHSWQMALMALLMHRHLAHPVDIEKTLKMILVHDLVEAEVGDVPFFDKGERKRLKAAREQRAIAKIRDALDPATGQEIHDLWQEYEAKATAEARFATALDHLEVQVQHNLADFATWEPVEYELVYTKMDGPCAVDPFLTAFCGAVKEQAERKMRAGGIDPAAVARRLAAGARP